MPDIAASLARVDTPAALGIIERIPGYGRHKGRLLVAQVAAERDVELALTVADSVERQYTATRASVIGVIAKQVAASQPERVPALVSRLPGYVESQSFRNPLHEVANIIASELTRVGQTNGKGAAELASPRRAHALMATARELRKAAADPRPSLCDALEALLHRSAYVAGRDEALVRLVRELAPLDPWRALQASKTAEILKERERAMAVAVRGVVEAEGSGSIETLCAELFADTSGSARYEGFRTLLSVLPSLDLANIALAWVGTSDEDLADRLRAWYIAPIEPNTAAALMQALGYGELAWKMIVPRLASRDSQAALEAYRSAKRGVPATDEPVLEELIETVADRDPEEALAILRSEVWSLDVERSRGLASIAGPLARTGWFRALTLARTISDPWSRSRALSGIWSEALREPPAEAAVACQAVLEVGTLIRYPEARRSMFREMLRDLYEQEYLEPAILAGLIAGMALGDRRNFLDSLPDLAFLACSGRVDVTRKLSESLQSIEQVLSA